jgi:hypothetical protein
MPGVPLLIAVAAQIRAKAFHLSAVLPAMMIFALLIVPQRAGTKPQLKGV